MARAWADQSLLERMVSAVERVRDRLERATAALEGAGVPYAIIGGNAVAAWVATVDPAAVRNTRNVDLLLHRRDVVAARRTLADVRIELRERTAQVTPPTRTACDARVDVCIADEAVGTIAPMPSADISDAVLLGAFRTVRLDRLIRMKLARSRTIDRVHLRDMLEVGLIDVTWPARFEPELAGRLQMLIDTPEG